MRRGGVAVLPVGSFEQHGPFLPLATDTIVATAISDRICLDHQLFPLPPVTISCSHEHAGFPGTVSISAVTLHSMIGDIWRSLARDGWSGLVVVSGHGGNYVLSNAVQELNVDGPRIVLFPTPPDVAAACDDAALSTRAGHSDMHGGEYEVSLLLHLHPELVRPGYEETDWETEEWRGGLLTRGMRAYTPHGVIGRPSAATAQKGARILASLSASLPQRLADLAETP
ncbi:creatininase family protein [Micromonospora sp. NPDC049171]|uniref:creatininase family protein n=1 Tax=Micromonospora sp. NPDC049171 TaxID=3155770 RepID=UPI0033ECE089